MERSMFQIVILWFRSSDVINVCFNRDVADVYWYTYFGHLMTDTASYETVGPLS